MENKNPREKSYIYVFQLLSCEAPSILREVSTNMFNIKSIAHLESYQVATMFISAHMWSVSVSVKHTHTETFWPPHFCNESGAPDVLYSVLTYL